MNDDNNNKNKDNMDKNVPPGSNSKQQSSVARNTNSSNVNGTDASTLSNKHNSNNSNVKNDYSRSMNQVIRNIDYESSSQPAAPRRVTSEADVDGSGSGKKSVEQILDEQKRSEVARSSSNSHQYEKDAKNFSSYAASKPTSPSQPVNLPREGGNTNDGLNAKQAMAMGRDPRLAYRKVDDYDDNLNGGSDAADDEDVSVALSMPRLVRAPQRTSSTPYDSELLLPTQRLIKVQPEAGCPVPGAYAARASASDALDASNRPYPIPEDSHDLEASSTPEMSSTRSDNDLVPRQPHFSAATNDESDTIASFGDEPLPSSPHHVEESGSNGSSNLKSKHRKRRFIFVGIASLLLVVGVGAGIGIAMSGSKTEANSPPPPSCSIDTVLDECSGNSLSTFQSDIPSCVADQYQTLRNTYSIQFRIAAPEEKSCSPENLALLSTALHTNETTSDTIISNRFGLSVLYFATGSNAMLKTEGWTSDAPHCEWGARLQQVQCNNTRDPDQVTIIWLGSSDLEGYLPSNLPLFLPNLHTLDVSSNSLTSTLPSDLASLSYLLVASNLLSGMISYAFTESKTLVHFTVSDNANVGLSRNQSFFSGTQLHILGLKGVDFQTGGLPTELLLLTNLVELDMGDMDLTGTFPNAIFNMTKLEYLMMPLNTLTGTLPSELGEMVNLKQLVLSYNSFNGTLPSQLGNLTNIEELSVEYNSLVGTIPSELGRLTQLSTLSVLHNELTGQMPTEMGLLTDIRTLYFGLNELSGTIPVELCALKSQGSMTEFGSPPLEDGGIDVGGLACPDTIPECCEPISS